MRCGNALFLLQYVFLCSRCSWPLVGVAVEVVRGLVVVQIADSGCKLLAAG